MCFWVVRRYPRMRYILQTHCFTLRHLGRASVRTDSGISVLSTHSVQYIVRPRGLREKGQEKAFDGCGLSLVGGGMGIPIYTIKREREMPDGISSTQHRSPLEDG